MPWHFYFCPGSASAVVSRSSQALWLQAALFTWIATSSSHLVLGGARSRTPMTPAASEGLCALWILCMRKSCWLVCLYRR